MRPAFLKLNAAIICFLSVSLSLQAQNCFNTGLNGSVINLPCNQNCVNVPVQIPHLKSTSTYTVNNVPYAPYAYVTAGGTEDLDIYDDDTYSDLFSLPFNFCFFDSIYTKVVVGSNGVITFDETNGTGTCLNAFTTSLAIPNTGTGAQCVQFGTYYPKASIMGIYTDLDPTASESPADRKIEWRVEGSAPCRRFVVSYYHVGTFNQRTCGLATPTTFQIVLYESTGIVEVFIENHQCQSTTSPDAILGMQNWARNTAVWAPGKNSTLWTASNEGYRFTPSGGASRFVSCEVFAIGGTVPLAVGDTATSVGGLLDVTFPSFCPTGTGGQYVVKTTFAACDLPAGQIVSYDTITINKTNSLDATATTTQTSCGINGTGTATITVPAGIGTAPYTFVRNPGNVTLTGNSPQTFTGLTAGTYNITVTDQSGGCTSTVPVTITSTGTLALTFNTVNTTCVGATNGSITVNPPNGTPPITYGINGGPLGPNNVFSNLGPGTYFITVRDNAGCEANLVPVTINSGPSITMTTSSTPTSCPGANNGTITINSATGTAPYLYSINGGPFQPNNVFTGVPAGTHFISVTDAVGCTITFVPVAVDAGAGTVTGTAVAAPTACTGATNGSITVTATSGVGPYEYSLNGGPYQASNIFNNLAAGTYTIRIREAGLCVSANITVTVTAGSALLATGTTTATSCSGASDGTITVTPSNGTAPFTFVLDGTVTQNGATASFTGIAAGAHSVVVTDAAGCVSAPISTPVTAGPPLTGTAAFTATSCPGVNNGTITVTATNGAAPFTYSLDGNAPQASNVFSGVAAGAHNVVIRTASGCVSANIPVTVTAGAGLTATIATTTTSCTGVNNGTITVTPTNGSGPYTFTLDGTTTLTGATATFTGVGTGAHSITITDNIGCTTPAALPANVTAGGGFTATFTSVNSSCAGVANGSITVVPGTGGTGPYTFVLDGTVTQTGAANTTFNNVTSGTHSILITDAVGCQFTLANATVSASAGFTATHTSTQASCAGATNGSITVTPGTGGVAPYTFVLDGTTTLNGPTAVFTNVASGTHSILITDAIGCQFTISNADVTAASGFTATYTATTTSCSGASNGSITVTPGAGGTGPYTFVLDGTTTQTGAISTTFNNIATGAHSILITDANGCQFTLSNANVVAGPPLAATVTPVATACPGVDNGAINITPTNGNGPYTFVLNGTLTQTGATTTSFTGVAAGTHSVVVTDANGCSSTFASINVASGTGITATVSPTGTSCTGATNGSITITPTNGTGPFTFILNGTTTQTGATSTTFTGLAAGNTYTIAVTDAIGCTGVFNTISVPQGSVLLASATPAATSCSNAANGEITVTPTNGAGPFTFVLNGTTTQTGATSTTFTNLVAGSYSIVVTDAAGCVSDPVLSTVSAGPPITVTLTKTDATCFGSSTGSISASPSSNASGPVEYSIDNAAWQTAPDFTGLAAATYTVYMRDNVGCTNSATITVGQPAAVAVTTTVHDVLCNGQSNGVIMANASGGTGAFSYSIDNTNFQAANTFNVPAGSYTVYVRDANGCTAQAAVNVAEPVTLSAVAATTNATCDGGANGAIVVTPTGGTAPFQYTVAGGNYQTTATLNVIAGTYDVTVRDANGCTFTINGVVVGLTNNLTLTPAIDPAPICEGRGVQLQLTTNATQFAWTPASSLSNSSDAAPTATPSTSTLYTVTATLGNCSIQDDVYVEVIPAPVPDAGPDGDICYGQTFTLSPVGDPSYTYNWSPATALTTAVGYNPVSNPDQTTTYSLTVTDANGCQSLQADQVTVYVTPPIQVTTFPSDTTVVAGAQVQLLATSAGTSYTWSPSGGLDNPNIANPIATAPLADGDVMVYQVTTTTSAGCQGDAYVTIRVYKGPDLYVANAFSPNGDGRNEEFIPFPVGIKQLNYFRVFNRWGQLMFATTTLNKGWDGRLGGMEQPMGVYVWLAEAVTMDNKVISKKGTVTLVR